MARDPAVVASRLWRTPSRARVTGVLETLDPHSSWVARYEEMHAAETVQRQAPRTLGAPHPAFDALRTWRHPATFRALLRGARVAGAEPVVLAPDGRGLAQSAYDRESLEANPVMSRRLHRPRHARGRRMCLAMPWFHNHFHWMLDLLPRLSLLPLDEEPGVPILVPAGLTGGQRETLRLAGVGEGRLEPFDGTQLAVDELWFPSRVGGTGNPPAHALRWLRERLLPEGARRGAGRRLYVTRDRAASRRVANEDAVLAVLAPLGFERFDPSGLPVGQQLAAFAAADAVVGPHGAGLTGLMCASAATVVELFEQRYVNGCYYALSDALGLPYWYLVSQGRGDSDIHVDLDALRATLQAAAIS